MRLILILEEVGHMKMKSQDVHGVYDADDTWPYPTTLILGLSNLSPFCFFFLLIKPMIEAFH